MEKREVVDFLNIRRELCKQNKNLTFTMEDIVFIRLYIHHSTGKLIDPSWIMSSFRNSPGMLISISMDTLYNKLVEDFKIEFTVKEEVVNNPTFNAMYGFPHLVPVTVKFIEKYY